MNREPKIDILMVNHNHRDRIGKSIESVLNQTYSNFRLLIVDDGSDDGSCEVIRRYAGKDPRIVFCPQRRNRHICHATNVGLRMLEGEYLARIDSDDIWYPRKLEKQAEFFAEHPESKICFAWVDLLDEHDRIANERDPGLFGLLQAENRSREEWLRRFFYHGNCLCQSSVVIARAVVEETGAYNPAYRQLSDFDYWMRIAQRYPLYVYPERLAALRRFFDGEVKNTSSYEKEDQVRMFYENLHIQKDLLENLDRETFRKAFGQDFRDPHAGTSEELECEKAFLLLHASCAGVPAPLYGMLKLGELLKNEKTCRVLEETYGFSAKDFYQLSGQSCVIDQWVVRERQELERSLQEADRALQETDRALQEKQRELDEIQGSRAWRAVCALRSLKHRLKP